MQFSGYVMWRRLYTISIRHDSDLVFECVCSSPKAFSAKKAVFARSAPSVRASEIDRVCLYVCFLVCPEKMDTIIELINID